MGAFSTVWATEDWSTLLSHCMDCNQWSQARLQDTWANEKVDGKQSYLEREKEREGGKERRKEGRKRKKKDIRITGRNQQAFPSLLECSLCSSAATG